MTVITMTINVTLVQLELESPKCLLKMMAVLRRILSTNSVTLISFTEEGESFARILL